MIAAAIKYGLIFAALAAFIAAAWSLATVAGLIVTGVSALVALHLVESDVERRPTKRSGSR